jgi:RNA polymerase sigma-70 factor (ECF subfamily)
MLGDSRSLSDLGLMSLWLAGEIGQVSLARTGEGPDAHGLRAAVDQHAAQVRDALGGRLSEGVLLNYARGFVEACVARGWWPLRHDLRHDLRLDSRLDWESLRLAAVCRLFLEVQGLGLLPAGISHNTETNWANACGTRRSLPIFACVIGESFTTVLAAAQDGSEAAFTVLWRDVNPALVRYLRVIAPEAAEDVAAETWLQALRGLSRFRGTEENWRAWLFTIARSRAVDERRRRSRRTMVPLDEMSPGETPVAPDAGEVALQNLRTERAIALIGTLPALQAEVIMLRVVGGMDTQTVAEVLGRSPGAVRVAAHRGLRRLAAMLAQTGVTL